MSLIAPTIQAPSNSSRSNPGLGTRKIRSDSRWHLLTVEQQQTLREMETNGIAREKQLQYFKKVTGKPWRAASLCRIWQEERVGSTQKNLERLLAIQDVAALAGVTDGTVRRWQKKYGLPVVKLGGLIRIRETAWLAWLEKQNPTRSQFNGGTGANA